MISRPFIAQTRSGLNNHRTAVIINCTTREEADQILAMLEDFLRQLRSHMKEEET